MAEVSVVTDEDFDAKVLKEAVPVLVVFGAAWSARNKELDPIIDQIAAEKGDSLKVFRLDIDDSPNVGTRYGVRSVPTLIMFVAGKMVALLIGKRGKSEIDAFIAPWVR